MNDRRCSVDLVITKRHFVESGWDEVLIQSASSSCLGTGQRVDKINPGVLANSRGKTVDEIIQGSVEKFLDRSNL